VKLDFLLFFEAFSKTVSVCLLAQALTAAGCGWGLWG